MEKFWVPTSFQSTTSILGTQGSSNFSCIKPTQGFVLLMMLGGSNFETRKKGFLLLGGGSYHQIPVIELVPRMPMTMASTYLPRGIHGQFLSSCKRLPSRLLIERDIFGLILANPNKGHFWSLTGGEDSPCVWGPKCQGCHSFSWTHLLSRMMNLYWKNWSHFFLKAMTLFSIRTS